MVAGNVVDIWGVSPWKDDPLLCIPCLDVPEYDPRPVVGEVPQVDPQRVLKRSRIPETFWRARLGDLTADEHNASVILAINGWLQEGGALFLCGPVGVGKSTVSLIAAAERARAGLPVQFWSAPEVAAALLGQFEDPERQAMLRALRGDCALVLDDLGIESTSDSFTELLFLAIEGRLKAGVPLIVTSNLTPVEAGARYGTWLASRLAGEFAPMRLLGPDRRLSG